MPLTPTDNPGQTASLGDQLGDPYCGNCGYALKGLTDSSKCPECGKPLVETLMRRGFPTRTGKRYRSTATLFGMPAIDIAIGPRDNEVRGKARGFIAIGDIATGVLAIGGFARGFVAIGGIAVGIFSIGGLAAGLFTAIGGFALAGGIAAGGDAVGSIALGGLAIGLIAEGGLAIGSVARGIGRKSAPIPHQLNWLLGQFPHNPLNFYRPVIFVLLINLLASAFLALWGYSRDKTSD